MRRKRKTRKRVVRAKPAKKQTKKPAKPKKLKIFVGSSRAAKSQANAFIKALQTPTVKFIPWWDAFRPGHTLLGELDRVLKRVDGAVVLFSPESKSTINKKRRSIPNLNVLFELGYFYGHLGKKKVAMLKYGQFYLPSDLGGYIHINGSRSFHKNSYIKIGKGTTKEFNKWLKQL